MESPYIIMPIAIGLVALYIISFFLTKKNILPLATHKRIWNITLFLSFFVVGITGMMQALRTNYGWFFKIPLDISFIHVEVGIVMFFIVVFHILWHSYYFKDFFKKR
jgi:nitrogen fixation-related uncharacterized protein